MTTELSELGQLALEAAQRGRDVITTSQLEGGFAVRTKSSHRDLVTDVDTAAERAVTDFLRQHRPHDAILGEEGGQREGSGNVRWIIDPIDGTANFAHGRADFAVAVAAEVNGTPAAGAIIRPATGRWIASDETGTIVSSHGTPSVSSTKELSAALVSVSVSISEERRPLTLSTLVRLLPEVQDFRRTGSTSCDLFDVATGGLDAYIGSPMAGAGSPAEGHIANQRVSILKPRYSCRQLCHFLGKPGPLGSPQYPGSPRISVAAAMQSAQRLSAGSSTFTWWREEGLELILQSLDSSQFTRAGYRTTGGSHRERPSLVVTETQPE